MRRLSKSNLKCLEQRARLYEMWYNIHPPTHPNTPTPTPTQTHKLSVHTSVPFHFAFSDYLVIS